MMKKPMLCEGKSGVKAGETHRSNAIKMWRTCAHKFVAAPRKMAKAANEGSQSNGKSRNASSKTSQRLHAKLQSLDLSCHGAEHQSHATTGDPHSQAVNQSRTNPRESGSSSEKSPLSESKSVNDNKNGKRVRCKSMCNPQQPPKSPIPDIFVTSHFSAASSPTQLKKERAKSDPNPKFISGNNVHRRASDTLSPVMCTLGDLEDKTAMHSHRHSSPSLYRADVPLGGSHFLAGTTKRPLQKSLSDSLCAKSGAGRQQYEYSHFLTRDAVRRYKSKPSYYDVDGESLYVGNLEVAYNEPLLCKLGVGSVVDLSTLSPDQVPESRKCNLPCLCSKQSHKPAVMRLTLTMNDVTQLEQGFTSINKFINGAMDKGRKVVIVGNTCCKMSLLVAMQYLLRHRGFSFQTAYTMISEKQPFIQLSDELLKVLQKVEASSGVKHDAIEATSGVKQNATEASYGIKHDSINSTRLNNEVVNSEMLPDTSSDLLNENDLHNENNEVMELTGNNNIINVCPREECEVELINTLESGCKTVNHAHGLGFKVKEAWADC